MENLQGVEKSAAPSLCCLPVRQHPITRILSVLACLSAIALVGCGQRGPLVHPHPSGTPASAPRSDTPSHT